MASYTGVSAVEKTENSKLGPISATYATQKTCPETCPFLNSGCYAEQGNTGFQTRRLNNQSIDVDIQALAETEAQAIDNLSGERLLRIHVVGDCKTDQAAQTVSAAADRYSAKHGMPALAYTHAFETVSRESWGNVSVLASTESTQAAKHAMLMGYAAAIVVKKHKDSKAWIEDGLKLIPCPQQTGKSANCAACKLCWNAPRLRATNSVIAFRPDGTTGKKVSAAIDATETR